MTLLYMLCITIVVNSNCEKITSTYTVESVLLLHSDPHLPITCNWCIAPCSQTLTVPAFITWNRRAMKAGVVRVWEKELASRGFFMSASAARLAGVYFRMWKQLSYTHWRNAKHSIISYSAAQCSVHREYRHSSLSVNTTKMTVNSTEHKVHSKQT